MSEPTDSVLFYLVADRFVAPLVLGAKVPCTGTRVNTNDLACMLCANALWSLDQQGMVDLRIVPRATAPIDLFDTARTQVRVILRSHADRPGLEGLILRNVGSTGDNTIVGIMRRCLDRNAINPWQEVVRTVEQEAVALGYVQRAGPVNGLAAKLLRHATQCEPDCAKIAVLKGQFNRLSYQWQSFQLREPDLFAAILDDCRRGIASHISCSLLMRPV